MRKPNYKHRPVLHWVVFVIFWVLAVALVLMAHPQSPLSDAWNPLKPLRVTDQVTPLTKWKLRRTLAKDATCLAALETGATFQRQPDLEESAVCHIRPRVELSEVAGARVRPFATRCQTALRMAMWTQHALQPSADALLNQSITGIDHFASFSCRRIRTASGASNRMSTHATADAIDIAGFRLSDGTRISLLQHWKSGDARAEFLHQANQSACRWFRLTLGPNYNALHADHFHLQNTGWGLCR